MAKNDRKAKSGKQPHVTDDALLDPLIAQLAARHKSGRLTPKNMSHPLKVAPEPWVPPQLLPFIAHATWQDNLRACLLLGVTHLIYVFRAWTEEQHVKSDPAYVAYCQWMDKHSLFAQIRHRVMTAWK